MPKLLTFGVCRQAIINRDDGAVSLINLVSSVTIQRQPDQVVPLDANSPFDWAAAAVWLRLDGDEGKTFEQRSELVSPNGDTIELGKSIFSMNTKLVSNTLRAQGFPIGQVGIVTLKVDLRKTGEQGWTTFAEYPLEVIHQIQEEEPIVTD